MSGRSGNSACCWPAPPGSPRQRQRHRRPRYGRRARQVSTQRGQSRAGLPAGPLPTTAALTPQGAAGGLQASTALSWPTSRGGACG
eukprot:10075572-Lingulodinium_polyedra.AAC.1